MRGMKRISGMLLSVFMAVFFFGCEASDQKGRLSVAGPDMTIEYLVKHWKDYQVSYAGVNRTQPTALLFDPKGDDRIITLHRYWASVDTEAELLEVMRWMQPSGGRIALYKILGPAQQVFGYLYILASPPEIKVVDDRTLWIGNVTLRDFEGASQN